MAITVASNFDQTAAVPLDSRTVVADSTARDAIASGVRYEGLTVYVVADAKNYQLIGGIANGDWTELQGAGGGGINYILTPDGADITGWAAYADAAGTSPVDGTGGSPATTFAVSTDSSLVGTENFVWTKSAADRQGEGFAYSFSIDQAYQSKPMTISALYKVASGTYADNDMSVWVYDVTNAVLIQPSAYQIKNSTGVETIKCEFQAASNSTSYRLIFHTASTSASAYTLRFDSFSVSPNTYNTGASVTAPVAYTPTFVGFGTVSAVSAMSWRNGANLEGIVNFTSGTSTAVPGTFTLGFGGVSGNVSVDTTKITANTIVGIGGFTINSAAVVTAVATSSSTTTLGLGWQSSVATGTTIVNGSSLLNSGQGVSIRFSVPIAGWGTSQVLSSDTDTRVVAASYTRSTGGATGIAIIKFNVKRVDTTSSYDTSTGIYTVPVAGTYRVSAQVYQANAAQRAIQIRKNSSVLSESYCPAAGGTTMSATIISTCSAGDTFDIYAAASLLPNDNSADEILTIERLSGPAQVAASEKVYLKYTGNAGGAITANVTNVDFTTKVTDSHGSWSGTTFTAPRPSWYDFDGSWNCTTGAAKDLQLYINGSAKEFVSYNTTGAASSFVMFSGGAYLNAGETATLRSDTSATLSNSATLHWLSIRSQG